MIKRLEMASGTYYPGVGDEKQFLRVVAMPKRVQNFQGFRLVTALLLVHTRTVRTSQGKHNTRIMERDCDVWEDTGVWSGA